jgi:glutathione S-transferase
MNSLALAVYAGSWLVLFVKFVLTLALLGAARVRSRTFRYAEDAAYWRGQVADEAEPSLRARRLLHNDAESQPYYLALGSAYLALGAWPAGAPYYFAAFTLARVAHAYCLLRGLQPLRTRAFALGLGVLLVLAVHVALACLSPGLG